MEQCLDLEETHAREAGISGSDQHQSNGAGILFVTVSEAKPFLKGAS